MISDLSKQPNIGKDTEAKLMQVEMFLCRIKVVGTEQAYLQLHAMDPGACIQLLYVLHAAIENIPVNLLSEVKKQESKLFHKLLQK